jgi:hypothetical protein
LGISSKGAALDQRHQRGRIDVGARQPHSESPQPLEPVVHRWIGDGMHEHRHPERGGGREGRARLRRIGQKIALRALDEHSAQAELLHRARELARRDLARIGIDGGKPVETTRIPAHQIGDRIVDARNHVGGNIAVGILEECCRRVDHPGGDARLLNRRHERAWIAKIAIDALPIRSQGRRGARQGGQREIRPDIVIVEVDDFEWRRALACRMLGSCLRRFGKSACRGHGGAEQKLAPSKRLRCPMRHERSSPVIFPCACNIAQGLLPAAGLFLTVPQCPA